MSASINNGGPAFPIPPNEEQQKDKGHEPYPTGMSLRDYFAAKALQAILSHERNVIAMAGNGVVGQIVAEHSYMAADAMLAEREKAIGAVAGLNNELLDFVKAYVEDASCGDGGEHPEGFDTSGCWHCTAVRLVKAATGEAAP